ncbi:unnamed protein product [Dicrocoelium dendriticum]|nr:unnamed protein product [Dicrocoelium dendriticum]
MGFASTARKCVGRAAYRRFMWISLTQFHFFFYASRSLPNTLALIFGGSILVDSFFWRRFVWPEGVVFYYNTILNKSIQWGSSPFHWYFSSALPRALLGTYAFSLMCAVYVLLSFVWNRSTRMCVIPTMVTGLMFTAFAFVFLYSWLPHKELRFIIYAIPLFNLAAGTAWAKLEQADIHIKVRSRSKSSVFIRKWTIFTLYAHLVVNISCTFLLLLAAKKNYPGGDALAKLNSWPGLRERPNVQIHICNLAAQTGVTRFLEEHPRWIYNKTEHIENDVQQLLASGFTHIISEIPAEQMSYLSSEFKLLFTVDAFSKIRVRPNLRLWRFVELLTAPSLAIYERKSNNTT